MYKTFHLFAWRFSVFPSFRIAIFFFVFSSSHGVFSQGVFSSFHMASFRMASFRLFAWRLFVFSHGVFSSFCMESFRREKTKSHKPATIAWASGRGSSYYLILITILIGCERSWVTRFLKTMLNAPFKHIYRHHETLGRGDGEFKRHCIRKHHLQSEIFCLHRDSNPDRWRSRQVLNLQVLFYCTGKRVAAAQWVKRWLTKLDPGSNPVRHGILSDHKQVNGVRLHTTYHDQPDIV